jgi:hypothetical protein
VPSSVITNSKLRTVTASPNDEKKRNSSTNGFVVDLEEEELMEIKKIKSSKPQLLSL